MRIILAGATGTIGRAVARRLVQEGHEVLCPLRPGGRLEETRLTALPCTLATPGDLTRALAGRKADAVISCMASRTGAALDAWAVDYEAQLRLLHEARAAGAQHFVLLSAICVQKPRLAFQHAKLAFEAALQDSGLGWSIVRPTAYFKSLSGQVARVQAGKPFLIFGDGTGTACKPISDADLAQYLVQCLTDTDLQERILPIGGPGPAITPLAQAHGLFEQLGQAPKIRRVPLALMSGIVGALRLASPLGASLRDKAEFARTGQYYATESMLVWDPARGVYDAEATPEFGTDTLWDHYANLIAGQAQTDLGAHAVF